MQDNLPLVTIAIPTYNRSGLLVRAIFSAQKQTYKNIEIIISDNCSSDDTEYLCRDIATQDGRIHYFRQAKNIGGTGNFNWLLSRAAGAYFMWLGDDDWIDANYVESCLNVLEGNPDLAFVSGSPVYYKTGVRHCIGRVFDVVNASAKHRIISYLFRVTDNGVFYGLFRKESIQGIELQDRFAGDWFFLCDVLTSGGFRMDENTQVHRELGGATESYEKLAKLYKLPRMARFIPSYYAAKAFRVHLIESSRLLSHRMDWCWTAWVMFIILVRPITNLSYRFRRRLKVI